jgi:ribosome biogenesis GTPase
MGGLLLDTPGMRELQLWGQDDTLENSFADIEALAKGCRFSDCKHESEPGCAVMDAVEQGVLPQKRIDNFKKLRTELTNLTRRTDNRGEPLRRELRKAQANDRKPKQKSRR